ncbi:MAG TPA: glycosyltransferase family 4 protein [Thermoleophilaceae bacterium]
MSLPRVLALSADDLAAPPRKPARFSGVCTGLERRGFPIAFVRPRLPAPARRGVRLLHPHPDPRVRRIRADLSSHTFEMTTRLAGRLLRAHDGEYDVILEVLTLFAPGRGPRERPYVVYTDNILPLTLREYPPWAPLTSAQARRMVHLEGELCRRAAAVCCTSRRVAEAMVADYGCDPLRVGVVGAGANVLVPARLDRGWDSRTALFVGYGFERKGGHVLLDAWPRVRERIDDARLVVVGPPRQSAPRLPAGVEWRGPVRDRDQLERLYDEAATFVMPSLFEPWGLVFLEAMGRGTASIGTRACAIPEMIRSGDNGVLVPPRDPDALASALVELLGDPARAEALGRRAHADVLDRWTWDHVAERVAPWLERAAR